MTIKFNFYDIYGFALPGFLLLALLWLPFGLIENKWPDVEFSSALVGVILAYFAGHLLQTVAHHALSSSLSNGRYPSDVMLDDNDNTFTTKFKERLGRQILSTFELDVEPNTSHGKAYKVRRDAFFLCRSALIKSKTVIYAEQFEGLYALMRGLSAAFAIAVPYYLGWGFSMVAADGWSGLLAVAGLIVALIGATVSTRTEKEWKKRAVNLMTVSLLLAAFAAGHHLGTSRVASPEQRSLLIAAAVFTFFAAERCYAGYRAFAEEFVKAVYRDFSNCEPGVGGDQQAIKAAGPTEESDDS